MPSLIHIVYASVASSDFHEHEIPALLEQARRANDKRCLTGMLLYIGGMFVQVLEGKAAMVDAVMATIARDRRHENVSTIIREPIAERHYAEWPLGHATVDPIEAGQILGEEGFFESPSSVTCLRPAQAKSLLSVLGNRRWKLRRTG